MKKRFNKWWLPKTDKHIVEQLAEDTDKNRGCNYQTSQRDYTLNFAGKFLSRRRTAIDIGAHVGLWAVDIANYFTKVVCFEPVPEFVECLEENLKDRNIENYEIHCCALGEEESNESKIVIEKENTGNSHLELNPSPDTNKKVIDTVIKPLDSFKIQQVDLIKIDAEGYEWQVLKGAEKTIEINRPIIVLEYKDKNTSLGIFSAMKHWLYNKGYKIDNWIHSEVIFYHKDSILRDWDKGKKEQKEHDYPQLIKFLEPDYRKYDDED